jgi:hypothetical protein
VWKVLIVRRGTVMTCSQEEGIFSWQGQSALGSCITERAQTWLENIITHAAGTFSLMLGASVAVATAADLVGGQMAMLHGKEGGAPPVWTYQGDGPAFVVGPQADLEIRRIVVASTSGLAFRVAGSALLRLAALQLQRGDGSAADVSCAGLATGVGQGGLTCADTGAAGVTVGGPLHISTSGTAFGMGATKYMGEDRGVFEEAVSTKEAGLYTLQITHDELVALTLPVESAMHVSIVGDEAMPQWIFNGEGPAFTVAVKAHLTLAYITLPTSKGDAGSIVLSRGGELSVDHAHLQGVQLDVGGSLTAIDSVMLNSPVMVATGGAATMTRVEFHSARDRTAVSLRDGASLTVEASDLAGVDDVDGGAQPFPCNGIRAVGGFNTISDIGPFNAGVLGNEDATGAGYMMYSATDVHDRFESPVPIDSNWANYQADHFVCVVYNGGRWRYDTNHEYVPFDPESSDVLVAEIDFGADTVRMAEGYDQTKTFGSPPIQLGYRSGDLTVTPNRWNGESNLGEFGLGGTHFTPWSESAASSGEPASALPAELEFCETRRAGAETVEGPMAVSFGVPLVCVDGGCAGILTAAQAEAGITAAQFIAAVHGRGITLDADPICFTTEYTTVPDDPKFRTDIGQNNRGVARNYNVHAGWRYDDTESTPGGPFGLDKPMGTWYRLPDHRGLATSPPGRYTCSTDVTGWLSGYVQTSTAPAPRVGYSTWADGTLPPPVGAPPAGGTVCFDACIGKGATCSDGTCYASVPISAVSCGAFALWALPAAPHHTGYCLAA